MAGEEAKRANAGGGTEGARRPSLVFEVEAAYNRERLPLPGPNGPNGRRILDLQMLLHHPFYWEWLNERETEEVLMEIYVQRTRRSQ